MTSIRLPTTAERATRITLPRAKDLDWILKSAQRGEQWAIEEYRRLLPALEHLRNLYSQCEKYEETND
jgi:hypothetical protein